MTISIERRNLIPLLGGVATTSSLWPLAARAQQSKRLGVLMFGAATEPEWQSNLATLVQGLRKLGWIEGQNLQIEVRWSAADLNLMQAYATDLVGLFKPDVLLAASTSNLIALQRATKTIPIVFTNVSDPVEQGFVPNLTHPGGNITGFAHAGFSIGAKWADLLKQMAPSLKKVVLIFNPETSPQARFYVNAVADAAPSLGLDVTTAPIHITAEIEPTFARLSREPNVGLIFPTDSFTRLRAKLIVEAAARARLPAIYAADAYMTEGGLMQYFNEQSEQFRLASFYIDRILKGAKPGDLPVQLPTRFKFIVNRKTASALGLEVPLGILLAADEVIE
jgi:putative tryptophan/tyrosine transport system substrate-binding protein